MAFCASTNKAVSILQSMAQDQYVNEDIAFLSIHKLLKIKRKIDGEGNETFETSIEKDEKKLIRTKAKSIYNYDIIIIDEPDALNLSYSSTDVDCFGDNNGSINYTASGAITPYIYSLNGGVNRNNGDFNIFRR